MNSSRNSRNCTTSKTIPTATTVFRSYARSGPICAPDEAESEAQIEQLETAIDRLEDRKHEISAELEEAREAVEETDIESLKQKRKSVRSELDDVTKRLDVLQSVLTANREMLNPSSRALSVAIAG